MRGSGFFGLIKLLLMTPHLEQGIARPFGYLPHGSVEWDRVGELPRPSRPDFVSPANGLGPGAALRAARFRALLVYQDSARNGSLDCERVQSNANRRAQRGPAQREDVFRKKN